MAAGDVSKHMAAQVRSRIGDPGGKQISDTELYGYLNEGQMALAAEEALDNAMLPLTRIREGATAADTYSYDLPHDFLRERYVKWGTKRARRISLVEMDALRINPYYTDSASNPFYTIADGTLRFFCGEEAADNNTFSLYYVRKPMRVRAITAATADLFTVPGHGLTTEANYHDSLYIEDVAWESVNCDGSYALKAVGPLNPDVIQVTMAFGYDGTGGRMIHATMGQIATDEDPLVPAIFRGIIMDWATARCREQLLHFDEAARQSAHFKQRVEALKQHYGGSTEAFDGIAGDPAQRQAAG